MIGTEYKWNVSVYELSSMPFLNHSVVYDPDLPMIYTVPHGNVSERLSISESNTFLCMDNDTKYFNVEILPFSTKISVIDNTTNYTLSMSPTAVTNEAMYVHHGNESNH